MPEIVGQPNLTQFAEAVVEAASEQIRVAIPGVFTSVSSDLRHGSVQPSVARQNSAADPTVPDVPILFPTFGDGRITWPVSEGDPCLLIFSDRSLDEWDRAGGGGAVEPVDNRTHDITDAVAIPMGLSGSGTGGDVRISLGGDSKVAVGGADRSGTYTNYSDTPVQWSGECELLSLMSDFLDLLVSKTPFVDLSTIPGALVEPAFNTLAELKARIDELKGSL